MFDDLIPQQDVTPTQRAFLTAMRGGESGGRYNVMYGGKTFDNFADHPRQPQPIMSGPNAGNVSTAAGADQFLARTWDEAKNALGLTDFSPRSQDRAAVWLAERDYKTRTGRNLWEDIESAKDNPGKLNYVGGVLSKTWTSLPGGAEPNRATGGFGQRLATEFSAQARPQAAQPAQAPSFSFDDLIPQQPQRAPEGPPRPPVSMAESAIRGANQGVLANFGDEFAGLRAAAGLPVDMGSGIPGALQAAAGAARMGVDYLTGGTSAQDAYNRKVEIEREKNKQAETQNPWSYLGGNVAGAVALPGGQMLQAATLPMRMARGAAVGAGYGGLSGAGEGEGALDRAGRATTGAAIGGVVGGVAPPLVEGAIQAGRAVVNPIVRGFRGAVNPEAEAARRVTESVYRGANADPQAVGRLTPQEYAASLHQGGPAMLMDLGGESTRALARSAGNTSPEGRQILNNAINDRFEGQTGRVVQWLRDTFNFPNADAQQQALEQTARTANRGAYARAYRDGADGVWSPELERLAGADAVTAAMQRAASKARDESIIGGYGAMNPRITFSQDGRMQFSRRPNGMPAYPDLQYWDLVRRELSDAAQNAGRGTAEARRLNSFATAMNAELDNIVPSYRQARQGAAAFFGAENALEAGQNFVTQNFATAETRRALAQMSQQERQLFQDGFVSRYVESLERVGDRRNVLNQIASSPAAREKLNLVLGRQRAAELEARLRVEGIMDLSRGAVQGNSTTARQLAELGLAGGATTAVGGYGIINQDPQSMTIAAVSAAILAGRRGIDGRVARRVAEMLASDDPQVLRRGIQLVARNEQFLNGLRATDRRIASVGAVESPKGVLSHQGVIPSHAESDQNPDVKGIGR